MDDLLKGLISKVHIIHINSTLQICAYPSLHHNVHYTINDKNIMKGIIKKEKEYTIKVEYYSRTKNTCTIKMMILLL